MRKKMKRKFGIAITKKFALCSLIAALCIAAGPIHTEAGEATDTLKLETTRIFSTKRAIKDIPTVLHLRCILHP